MNYQVILGAKRRRSRKYKKLNKNSQKLKKLKRTQRRWRLKKKLEWLPFSFKVKFRFSVQTLKRKMTKISLKIKKKDNKDCKRPIINSIKLLHKLLALIKFFLPIKKFRIISHKISKNKICKKVTHRRSRKLLFLQEKKKLKQINSS